MDTVVTRSYTALNNIISTNYKKLDNLKNSYILMKPTTMYEVKEQKLDILIDDLGRSINKIIDSNKMRLFTCSNSYILNNPRVMYENKKQSLNILIDNLNKNIDWVIDNQKVRLFTCSNSYVLNNPGVLYKYSEQKLSHIISKLEVLNPLNTLNRGYAIIKKDDKVLSSIKNIKEEDIITITLKDGDVSSKIIKVGE